MVVFDFAAVLVGHVEHVDHLVQIGADFRPGYGKAQLEERAGDGVQQPGAVVGEDIEDRVRFGSAVVGIYPGLHAGDFYRTVSAHVPGAAEGGRLAAGRFQRLDQRMLNLLDAVGGRLAGKIGIVDPKAVEHQSIGQGVNLRRADRQPMTAQCARSACGRCRA